MKSFKQFITESIPDTDNPNFWKWFGNSVLVDRQKKPKIFSHFTSADFTTFRSDRVFHYFADNKLSRYFKQEDPDDTEMWVYLRMENPLDLRKTGWGILKDEDFDQTITDGDLQLKQYLIDHGYDGYICDYDHGPGIEYAVFNQTQIKSATHNNGDFDPNDPDITH